MSRQPLALGEHGQIEATPQKRDSEGRWKRHPSGRGADRYRARAYYRSHDGVIGEVSRVAATRPLAMRAVETALREALSPPQGDVTATMLLTDAGRLWLAQVARSDSGLSARTVFDYGATYQRLIDAPGSTIRGLTLAQVNNPQRLRTFLQGVADGHGTGSAKIAKSVLSGILGSAVNDGILAGNAVRQVRPVKSQTPSKASERDTRRAFTRDERDAVIAYADSLCSDDVLMTASSRRKAETTAALAAFMAGTGVRISEARALRWEQVDLDAGTVDVHGTKSTSSRRMVNLPSWLAARLLERSTRGTRGLVFSSPHLSDPERPWDQSNSADALAAVLAGAGFPWATPHTFRRTVATLLHEASVPIARIADQLGHADPAMTASIYLGRDLLGDKASLAQHL